MPRLQNMESGMVLLIKLLEMGSAKKPPLEWLERTQLDFREYLNA